MLKFFKSFFRPTRTILKSTAIDSVQIFGILAVASLINKVGFTFITHLNKELQNNIDEKKELEQLLNNNSI